ncbi:superoxide dismutase [Pseudonocardia sp. TRM90224]|uniref:superoxide dismutase n=1 Tax=Pseudonocardia sp. TRM90224 TaxID=2812678 RepID=UPI001E61EA77|nr:superoxide dismutase [Pseudonocardia sp. TRM90224]
MRRRSRAVLAGAFGLLALSGCAQASTPPPPVSVSAQAAADARSVQTSATFGTGLGDAITYDTALVPAGAHGAVSATNDGTNMTVTLALRGVRPNYRYGAHAHTQPCGAKGDDAGPHFQFQVDPVKPSVDPAYANPQNEIWLDLSTDPTGAGSSETKVAWVFPVDRRAKSVIVHSMQTSTEPGKAGTAGGRAACITVAF